MSKNIFIIGGGISGLAVLHYLKKKYAGRSDVDILLLEKNAAGGGTIQTIRQNGCLFETGPNGFLDSKPQTREFLSEIGLEDQIVKASESGRERFIALNGALQALPTGPKSFLRSGLLSPLEKLRVLAEIFVPAGGCDEESVWDFGRRRVGKRFADVFLDAMVSGIYAGDVKQLNLKAAFPRMFEMEEKFGSLFKAMIQLKKARAVKSRAVGSPQGTLTSLRQGMGQAIETLVNRYQECIRFGQDAQGVSRQEEQYLIHTDSEQYRADELFMCTPANAAARMLHGLNPRLSEHLKKIPYAPVAVAGLAVHKSRFKNPPRGFGYLIPSSEGEIVLGVLFESNCFPNRCPSGRVFCRVMIGGARHPEILEKSEDELFDLAFDELHRHFGFSGGAEQKFCKIWPQAIPQYDQTCVEALKEIERELAGCARLFLAANYWKGISFNECIASASQAAEKSLL